MLLDLRETVRNSKPIKYTLITLICVPFVLFGIGSYFSGGNAPAVAKVDGEEITQYQLDGAVQQQRSRLTQMFGGRLPEGFADDALLRQQALEQLVTQQVLEKTVADQRFAVGDKTLGKTIRDLPAFQLEGRFDSETYQTQLRASGLSVAAFEQSFRDDTALNQFRTGVVDTSFTLPSEAKHLDELARQTRTVDAVRFDLNAAKDGIEPTDDEIAAHFDENSDTYRFPERAKIQWIELDSAAMAKAIDITDAEAEARYEENRATYVRPEQRKASHILLQLDDDASDSDVADKEAVLLGAAERITGGESFGDVARELSDDIGSAESGGSLGVIAPGAMVPEFEAAVNELEAEGDLSGPVRSPFGLHLIRLDKITPESGKPFDEVKDDIVSAMREEQADREFFELSSELTELVFDESESLEPAADAAGLEIQSSDWLDADTIGDAGPALSNPAVIAAMNDPDVRENGNNSELIEVGPRHVISLRVTEAEGERPKTLEDVREQIIDELKSARAGEQLDALADAAIATLAASADPVTSFADEPLAETLMGEEIDRQSTVVDATVVAEIFALPRPGDDGGVTGTATLSDGDRFAYVLRSVNVPSAAASDEAGDDDQTTTTPPARAAGADPQLGGTEFQALLGSLRQRADVNLEP